MGYISRSMAKRMGYGVKKVHQVVEHEGEKFKMTLTNPKGTSVFEVLINGDEQDMFTFEEIQRNLDKTLNCSM